MLLIQTNGSRADLDLGARILLRPELVAAGQRTIEKGLGPVFLAGRLHDDIALDEAEARGTIRRIRLVRLAVLCPGQPEYEAERQGRDSPQCAEGRHAANIVGSKSSEHCAGPWREMTDCVAWRGESLEITPPGDGAGRSTG